MREALAPGDMVAVDQFIDLTKRRVSTFFEDGIVGHVAFGEPVCPILGQAVHATAVAAKAAAPTLPWGGLHRGGAYVCIEGPHFSTRAESNVYRGWGVDVIGMTNMPEAKLAREAELPYATLALVTDYDCWHTTEEAVDVEAVIARLGSMVEQAKLVIRMLARDLPDVSHSPARHATEGAIMTARGQIPQATRDRLSWLLPNLGLPSPIRP